MFPNLLVEIAHHSTSRAYAVLGGSHAGSGERVALSYGVPLDGLGADAARLRFVARCAYRESAPRMDPAKTPPALRAMPRFVLSSAPLELEVARPDALEVTVKGALPTAGARLAPLLDVVVTNRATTPRTLFAQGQ